MGSFEVPKKEIGFVRLRGLLFYLQYTLHIFLVGFFVLIFHVKTYICICHFTHQIVGDKL